MKFLGNIKNDTKTRFLIFVGDPDHCLDPRNSLKCFSIIVFTSNIGDVVPWRSYVLSECSPYGYEGVL